ncbi:MAG: hypothetical protein IJ272_09110 [Clostridia bacterium]|nr:hypothetical protein [Clostridia bacterium]
MKKDTLLEIILGTIGGLIFAIGMCMCLLPEWNMFTAGVIVTILGTIVLLAIIPIYRKSHPKKPSKPIDWAMLTPWLVGVIGSLIMGFGMSRILVEGASTADMVVGIITGVVGLVICVLNWPVYAYIKGNK